MAKKGLYYNINQRKKKGISRPKSKSTISAKAYKRMKEGFKKKKMIVFGHTPREWKRRAMMHKASIIVAVISFVLGAVIF